MLTLEVIVRGSSNFIGFRDICSKALLDAGFVVMLLLVLHLWGDLLEIGWRSDHFAASLFYYRISRGPKGSNISTSFIYSNSVHRLGCTKPSSSFVHHRLNGKRRALCSAQSCGPWLPPARYPGYEDLPGCVRYDVCPQVRDVATSLPHQWICTCHFHT